MAASSQSTPDHTTWPFPEADWQHTPPSVQQYVMALQQQLGELQQHVEQLQKQVDLLQGCMDKTSQTSSKPPSSDSPFKKPTRSKRRTSSGKRGARMGHPGSGPLLLEPTEVQHLYPVPCACGQGELGTPTLYHTHQRIALPPIVMQIAHFLLYQACSVGCGRMIKFDVPSQYATGDGPRLSGLIGELSGMHGTPRRLMQDFCHSVLQVPINLGAIQKVIDRVSDAIVPHYAAMAALARNTPVGYMNPVVLPPHRAVALDHDHGDGVVVSHACQFGPSDAHRQTRL